MKHRFTAALERFSRAMLAPLTYLSAAGLLLAAGALLTSTALSGALPLLQWGPVRLMGRILYKCLLAVISNLSVLFCTGLAASLAKQEKHQAAFIALMSYFIYRAKREPERTAVPAGHESPSGAFKPQTGLRSKCRVFSAARSSLLSRRGRRRVAAPCVCFVPWTALASCRPLPQQLLPVSAAGRGRCRCKLGAARP